MSLVTVLRTAINRVLLWPEVAYASQRIVSSSQTNATHPESEHAPCSTSSQLSAQMAGSLGKCEVPLPVRAHRARWWRQLSLPVRSEALPLSTTLHSRAPTSLRPQLPSHSLQRPSSHLHSATFNFGLRLPSSVDRFTSDGEREQSKGVLPVVAVVEMVAVQDEELKFAASELALMHGVRGPRRSAHIPGTLHSLGDPTTDNHRTERNTPR